MKIRAGGLVLHHYLDYLQHNNVDQEFFDQHVQTCSTCKFVSTPLNITDAWTEDKDGSVRVADSYDPLNATYPIQLKLCKKHGNKLDRRRKREDKRMKRAGTSAKFFTNLKINYYGRIEARKVRKDVRKELGTNRLQEIARSDSGQIVYSTLVGIMGIITAFSTAWWAAVSLTGIGMGPFGAILLGMLAGIVASTVVKGLMLVPFNLLTETGA